MLLWQRYDKQQDGGYMLLRKLQKKKRLQNRQTSSVYDCTVEDVEYIYNKFSLYTELVIDVLYIFNSTVVD